MVRNHIHKKIDDEIHKRSKMPRPLPGTFMLMSIIGLFISIVYTLSGKFNLWFAWSNVSGYGWGMSFILVFLFMFIAAMISITPRGEDIKDLDDAIRGKGII